MKTYYVEYKMSEVDGTKYVCVTAQSKADAYDKAVYETIPNKEGHLPYSAWVCSVTYSNGKRQEFNTCEGNPY